MTKLYEIMLLLRSEAEMQQKSLEAIRTKLSELGGTVDKETPMGDQMLAYPILKQKKGHYHLLNVSLGAEKLKTLDADLKLVDGLLRSLVVAK